MWQHRAALAFTLVLALAGTGISATPGPKEGHLSVHGDQALTAHASASIIEARSGPENMYTGSNNESKKKSTITGGKTPRPEKASTRSLPWVGRPFAVTQATTGSPFLSEGTNYRPSPPPGQSRSGGVRLFGVDLLSTPPTTHHGGDVRPSGSFTRQNLPPVANTQGSALQHRNPPDLRLANQKYLEIWNKGNTDSIYYRHATAPRIQQIPVSQRQQGSASKSQKAPLGRTATTQPHRDLPGTELAKQKYLEILSKGNKKDSTD